MKPSVSESQHHRILALYPWLRDDDARLKQSFAAKNAHACHLHIRKLARLRDLFRRQARDLASPTPGSRAALAMTTAGTSELARLIARKPMMAQKKKLAQVKLRQADATDMLLRFWSCKFQHAAAQAKAHSQSRARMDVGPLPTFALLAAFSQAAEADEASKRFPATPGELDLSTAVAAAEQEQPADDSTFEAALKPGTIRAVPQKTGLSYTTSLRHGSSLKPKSTDLRSSAGLGGLTLGEAAACGTVGALAGILL